MDDQIVQFWFGLIVGPAGLMILYLLFDHKSDKY